MKRLSTGVLVSLMVAGLGLSAVAAPSTKSHHPIVVAQASASPMPSDTGTMGSPAPSATDQGTMSPAPAETTSPAPAETTAPTTTTPSSSGAQMPAMNFGSPPSGQIPILFNDRHVYAKPDVLKQGRVLAALVRGGTVLIPLRSMFEQMGATVAWDPGSKTATVSKPGSEVKVTVGRPEVTINGEARPLDVPPMMYQGSVLVPVRVISEGMGAYVQWVPDKRVVVVRYAPATPAPPPPAPGPSVTTAPATPTPAPPPAAPYQAKFIVGDYIFSPKVYNEFSPGNSGKSGSYNVRAGLEFNLFNLPWMIEGDFRQYDYPHNCGTAIGSVPPDPECFVTVIGQGGQTFVPAFEARDQDFDGRLGLKVADPRIYIGVGYLFRTGNYGYPRQQGVGFGIEKLPDLDQTFSVYGSAWYYPTVKGTCGTDVCPTGPFDLEYRILKYQIGGVYNFSGKNTTGIFLDFGFLGDSGRNKENAPSEFTHSGPYLGLGIHF
ncbi:MAG: copper amine oxidase N-terminal domain-containing protein [Candidatus Eremiobacteraeota bacterium]|nr:copper amine oxidase N-terminal domain-containing protein [Candidatus Eremiobacteraeota bacterium]